MSAYTYVHHVLAWYLQKSEKANRLPETGATGDCEQIVGAGN